MNRTAQILAWGVAGAVLTGALTGAAIVVAGGGIATPVRPFSLTSNRVEQPVQEASEPHEAPGHDRGTGGGEGGQPGDDHGGDGTLGELGPGIRIERFWFRRGSGDSGGDHDGNGGGDDDD